MKSGLQGKVVVVTGATAGIGKAAAELFRAHGADVACVARRKSDLFDGVCADVTDAEQVKAAFAAVAAKYGRIDVLVCNAGGGISGPAEDTPPQEAKQLFDLNFFGALNAAQAALPYLRAAGGGRIVFVGSVAAEFAIPFQSFYSASKAALSSLACALRNEVAPFGTGVSVVLPGDVKTDFTASRRKIACSDVYGDRPSRAVAAMERDERNGMPPEKVAKAIVRAATRKRPPVKTMVGGKYRCFVFLARLLPARAVSFLLGKMYG